MIKHVLALGAGVLGAAWLDTNHADKAFSIRGVMIEPGAGAGALLGLGFALTGSTVLGVAAAGALAPTLYGQAKSRMLPSLPAAAAPPAVSGFGPATGTGLPPASYTNLTDQQVWAALGDLTRQAG